MNDRIRVSPVRLIGPKGEQVGILPIKEALSRAADLGLDLVEVAPKARPPVCRIMDYGKFKYETTKKDKAAKKKQIALQMKEMRFRPKIDEHDYQFKAKHIRSFLEAGSKVKAFVIFRGREMAHIDMGRKILDRVGSDMDDIAQVDIPPKLERNNLSMILSPRTDVLKQKQKEKDRAASAAVAESTTQPEREQELDEPDKPDETPSAE